MVSFTDRITQVLQNSQVQLLGDWIEALRAAVNSRSAAAISDPELQAQRQEFIALLSAAIEVGKLDDSDGETSALGTGSTFRLELPLECSEPADPAVEPPVRTAAPRAGQPRVLATTEEDSDG